MRSSHKARFHARHFNLGAEGAPRTARLYAPTPTGAYWDVRLLLAGRGLCGTQAVGPFF